MTLLEAQGWSFLIASLAAAILSLHNGWKIKEVHELTNSRLARIETELTVTKTLLEASRAAGEASERARASLAAAASTTSAVAAATAPAPPGVVS